MSPSPSLVWFLVGVAFLVAEFFAPGFILIFFTLGSWFTALTTWLTDMDLSAQILAFIVSSLTLLFTLRRFGLKTFKGKTADNLDDDYAAAQIGKEAVVTHAIQPHLAGEIKAMGTFWRAVADEPIAEGQAVRIEGRETAEGLTFKVKPL